MWWRAVRNRINRAKTSTGRTADGRVIVNDEKRFRGLPLSAHKEISEMIENECRAQFIQHCNSTNVPWETVAMLRERSAKIVPAVLNAVNGPGALVERVADALGFRDYGGGGYGGGTGGMSNLMWMTGTAGDPATHANRVRPNLYLTPGDAASIYSQKGLPEVIIGKKAKSMLLNGVKIKNTKLTDEQLEQVHEDMVKTGLAKALSDAVRDALVYSGSLLYPMFHADTPLTMTLPVEVLAKYGVIKKNCISRWVSLDRWNTVHYPQWNPTASDHLKPNYFYIPFMGTDVHSSRTARIVPAPQSGYWGVMMTMGWGVSDIVGWIESVFNYTNVMHAIPTMIQQMSILARTFNVDGPMAMEGAMLLSQMADEDTIRVRDASVLNPINMDVVGELKAIQRDFAEVPELTRLIRQDVAAKAGFLEEALFTVEKKGMGGSDSASPWTRQEETNRLMYAEVQAQLKPVAMLQVINALGLGRDVLKALPYTEIVFSEQKITDIDDKAKVLSSGTKGFFDTVAGGMSLPDAARLVEQMSGGLFEMDVEMQKRLEERQAILDTREQEKHDAEMELMNTQVAMSSLPLAQGGSAGKDDKDKKGHSYDDPMEQRRKEKISHEGGGTKKQGITKARNKIVSAK